MQITMLYAGALALVLIMLSVRAIQARASTKVFMGDGGNPLMIRRMRGMANFVEYVPMALILMGLLEQHGERPIEIHALGAILLVSRLAHGITFAFAENFPPGRFIGAAGSQLVIAVAGLLCLWHGFQAL